MLIPPILAEHHRDCAFMYADVHDQLGLSSELVLPVSQLKIRDFGNVRIISQISDHCIATIAR